MSPEGSFQNFAAATRNARSPIVTSRDERIRIASLADERKRQETERVPLGEVARTGSEELWSISQSHFCDYTFSYFLHSKPSFPRV